MRRDLSLHSALCGHIIYLQEKQVWKTPLGAWLRIENIDPWVGCLIGGLLREVWIGSREENQTCLKNGSISDVFFVCKFFFIIIIITIFKILIWVKVEKLRRFYAWTSLGCSATAVIKRWWERCEIGFQSLFDKKKNPNIAMQVATVEKWGEVFCWWLCSSWWNFGAASPDARSPERAGHQT